jgi:uncharacterized protein (DUF58 family)
MGREVTGALNPGVVAAIDDLELAARRIVEGLRAGSNRSPFHGFSTEFRQHRPYRAGDDLKYLDWKLFGRSDRLYTRQFQETTNLAVMIALDTSGSMAFPDTGLSKFTYGVTLAAALAYLVAEQGNQVGLMTMAGDALVYLPARGGRLHLRTLLARLEQLEPTGTFDAPRVIARAAQLMRRRGILLAISDFYDAEDATRRELRRVVRYGHDVAMLQLTSTAERELPYQGQVELEDLESGARRQADAGDLGPRYRAAVAAFLDRQRREAVAAGIDYALISVDTPPQRALRDWLLRREGRPTAR